MDDIAESSATTVARSPSTLLSRGSSKVQSSASLSLSRQPTTNASFSASSKRMPQSSSRSLASTTPSGSLRSGRSTPVQLLEMSVTEQIARKTRKSTVLDAANALRILAIPDYDDYKVLQPYSCRSLSNRSQFVGTKDFVTRHNPQEVSVFKQQYSREVGTLNRQRSVLAPPQSLLAAGSSAFALAASASTSSTASLSSLHTTGLDDSSSAAIWRQTFTAGQKPCWVLTDVGIDALIGPEYRITTRVSMLPALAANSSNHSDVALAHALHSPSASTKTSPFIPSIRSPLRPETPSLLPFTARESARIGAGVDLLDAKQLAALARTAAYSPMSRPASPLRSPYRMPDAAFAANGGAFTDRSPSKVHLFAHAPTTVRPASDDGPRPLARVAELALTSPVRERAESPPTLSPSPSSKSPQLHCTLSPMTQPFAMEISPPRIDLGTLRCGDVYLFPLRVRNVGFRQERFRVQRVRATCAGVDAAIAEVSYDKDAARLAPGLAAVLTLTLCCQHAGKLVGRVQVATEGIGSCDVEICGSAR